MTGEALVSLGDLRQALALLLDEIEKRHGKVIDLDADYYWTIGAGTRFALMSLECPSRPWAS